ncbi:MAG: hypothetical protein HYU63_03245 [Armatimonadetes bacterium]|nr:hypothetical protein [Armatimonadota bacterium]
MNEINKSQKITQNDILFYQKIIRTSKKNNKNIDEVVKSLPIHKRNSYYKVKLAYQKQLEETKKQIFSKPQTKWDEKAYETVKKIALREGSLEKAFEILPLKYHYAYYKIQEQKLGGKKAKQIREVHFKEKKEQIQKEIEKVEKNESWLKKADSGVAIARGITSFVTFGASESAINARYNFEKGDYKAAAFNSAEVIILSAAAAFTNAPGAAIKLAAGSGKLILNAGKGIYTTLRTVGIKNSLKYLKGCLPKLTGFVKEIPGAMPKIIKGLKTIPENILKSLSAGGKEIYNGVKTSLKYLPTKGGVIQGLGTIGAIDLAAKNIYASGKSYYHIAASKTKEERLEYIKQALLETGFSALGLWGLKDISNLAAFQSRIINGKDNLIKGESLGKISKTKKIERLTKIRLPEDSLTQKAKSAGTSQELINNIESLEKRLIDTDEMLGALREQEACGKGTLRLAESTNEASYPWIPREALFTSKSAKINEMFVLPDQISKTSQKIKLFERYSRYLNYKLRKLALNNDLSLPIKQENLLGNEVLRNDLSSNQETIKKITDNLNKKNISNEELKKEAQKQYARQLEIILIKKESIVNKLIIGYAPYETRAKLIREMALNTPLWKLKIMEESGVTFQRLNKGDDLLKAGFISPPNKQNFTDGIAYDPERRRIVIINGKNLKECAQQSIKFGKAAASKTQEEIKIITLDGEKNLASQIKDEEALIIGKDGKISKQLVMAEPAPQKPHEKIKEILYKIFFPPKGTYSPEYPAFRGRIFPANTLGSAKSFILANLLFNILGLGGSSGSMAAALATQASSIFYGLGAVMGKGASTLTDKDPAKYFQEGAKTRILGDGLELGMLATQALPSPLNLVGSVAAYWGGETIRAKGDTVSFSALLGRIEPNQSVNGLSTQIRAAATAQSALSSTLGLTLGCAIKGTLGVLPPFAFPITVAALGVGEYLLIKEASQLSGRVITQDKLENLIKAYLKDKKILEYGKPIEEQELEEVYLEIKKDVSINVKPPISEIYSTSKELTDLIIIYKGEKYLLNIKNNEIKIIFHIDSAKEDQLKAFYQAEKLKRALSSGSLEQYTKNYGENEALKIILEDSLKETNREFPEFLKALKEAKWKIKDLALPPGDTIW